eukprot:2512441-Prymnesium_polylepis.1
MRRLPIVRERAVDDSHYEGRSLASKLQGIDGRLGGLAALIESRAEGLQRPLRGLTRSISAYGGHGRSRQGDGERRDERQRRSKSAAEAYGTQHTPIDANPAAKAAVLAPSHRCSPCAACR